MDNLVLLNNYGREFFGRHIVAYVHLLFDNSISICGYSSVLINGKQNKELGFLMHLKENSYPSAHYWLAT
jgi:hypothetical protein